MLGPTRYSITNLHPRSSFTRSYGAPKRIATAEDVDVISLSMPGSIDSHENA